MRTILSECMLKIAESGNIPYFLTADISSFSLKPFADKYPDNFINVGVAEQAMIGIAAGLASQGKLVYVHSIDPFIVARAYEQIRVDIGINKLPVKIITVGDSLSYPKLGPTHSCPEGISLMRNIPGMKIKIPSCKEEARKFILNSATINSPEYIRLSSSNFTGYDENKNPRYLEREYGSAHIIFTYGSLIEDCLSVAKEHSRFGCYVGGDIINVSDLDILTEENLQKWIEGRTDIFIFEESFSPGGIGELIISKIISCRDFLYKMGHGGANIHRLCIKDHIQGYGSIEDAKNAAGIGKEDILRILSS